MPGCNVFNREQQMLLVHFFGTVTANDLESQAVSVLTNPDFNNSTRELISFAEVDGFAPDVDMEKLAEVTTAQKKQLEKFPEIKIAFLAPGSLAFNLALVYKTLVDSEDFNNEIGLFTDRHEAVSWLGGSPSEWDQLLDRISKFCSLG
ncbi:MAG: hypothetical protein CSA33_06935 [Desulfobulbus propionicus]|nr:MAG: hypothetical protein CSA33_06935 [Desulfobulbus propionicus]